MTVLVQGLIQQLSGKDFHKAYADHVKQMRLHFGRQRERIPYLQTIPERSVDAWQAAVLAGVERLHRAHAWRHRPSGKRISFGLVRVANIGPAIETARFLAERLPNARVACYHSQDYAIQRFLKEKRLDRLLHRQKGDAHIENDPEISDILAAAPSEEIAFIIVATPVEEIGRDHDFDWAVIDPSSVRSIVQTAGRVNRHRRLEMTEANIALLQFNHRWASGKESRPFRWPGFECGDEPYDSHDLAELLSWEKLTALDAGLMFDGNRFARLDNDSIRQMLEKPLARLFDLNQTTPYWTTQAMYDAFPLREQNLGYEWTLDEDGNYRLLNRGDEKTKWLKRDIKPIAHTPNDWLARHPVELYEACKQYGLAVEDGMRFSTTNETPVFDASFGAM